MNKKIVLLTALAGLSGVVLANDTMRGNLIRTFRSIAAPLLQHGESTDPRFDVFYAGMVESLPLEQRAYRALELAINQADGASEYLIAHAHEYFGKIKASEGLRALIGTSQNAPRIEVRMAGMEVYLAQYGIHKNAETVRSFIASLDAKPLQSDDPKKQKRLDLQLAQGKVYSLWVLGVLGARGVERELIYRTLLQATTHPDEGFRRAAVDAFAKMGGVEVIDPLLRIGNNDASMAIRERAFCGLASSGTLQLVERYEALPGLLAIAENPSAGSQMHAWSYQAMREITSFYAIPEQASAWRQQLERMSLLPSNSG